MNALELLQENPDAANIIKQYYVDLMINSLDDSTLPDDFKDFMRQQGVDNKKVAEMIEASPRNLFDVLDENGFVISMNWDMAFNKYTYHINDDQYKLLYDSRREAEMAAVNVAIHRLQSKLNPQPSAELYED
jgi:hypothetical protein